MAGILGREPLLDGRHADDLGYVNSVDETYRLIAEFETRLTTKFSCFKADKGFRNTGMYVYIYIYIYIKLFGNTKLCFHFQIEHSIKKEKSCLAIEYSH